MGIRTCFANDGPAAAVSSTAAIRNLFMVAPSRAPIARLGGVGDGDSWRRSSPCPPPRAKLGAPYASATTVVNRALRAKCGARGPASFSALSEAFCVARARTLVVEARNDRRERLDLPATLAYHQRRARFIEEGSRTDLSFRSPPS